MNVKARLLGHRGMMGRSLLLALSALILMLSNPATARTRLSLQPVSVTKNSLSIAVDPRIELLSIVQYLSDYRNTHSGLVTRLNNSYRKDVDEWFSRSKSHPVIEMFSSMSSKDFSYDAPPHAVLYLNADLSLNPVIFKDDKQDVMRAGGKEQMTAFARALKAFALESGFPEFYKNHIAFYKQITEETAKSVEDKDVIKQVEQYYGEKRNSYTVVISPLLGHGNFGPQTERKTGIKDIYCIMGPAEERNGIPAFGSTGWFHQLQWHEFGHSFVNPLADKYPDLWQKYSYLFPPMKEKMETQAYGEWLTVVDESVVRAVTIRLAYRFNGSDSGDKELRDNKSKGFVFSDALVKKLEEYEQNRTKYPTLDSFYPKLLKTFDGFSESSVAEMMKSLGGFVGSGKSPAAGDRVINESFDAAKCLVYEIPEGECRDDAISFIEKIHDKFFSNLDTVDATKLDDSTLKDKLKGDFVLYTTIGSRLFKAATQPLNIQIENGKLNWNGVSAPVTELRIILVGKNPYGDGNCVVYAAGCNKLLVGINGCFHGPCSYHIFQDKQLLKEGFYNEKSVIR